jgi:hypothetical protein
MFRLKPTQDPIQVQVDDDIKGLLGALLARQLCNQLTRATENKPVFVTYVFSHSFAELQGDW